MADTTSRVYPDDPRALAQVDDLLAREGIHRDRNLGYICGIYDVTAASPNPSASQLSMWERSRPAMLQSCTIRSWQPSCRRLVLTVLLFPARQ